MATKKECSYGIIPLQKLQGEWNILLVQLHAGHWGFPKGHPNSHETPLETAQRELFEETHLKIDQILSEQTFEESYFFKFQGTLIHKTVIYYLAEVGGVLKKMEEEIKDIKWIPLNQAVDCVTFDQAKRICQQVLSMMNKSI